MSGDAPQLHLLSLIAGGIPASAIVLMLVSALM